MNWVIEFRPETLRELEKLDPELKRRVVARLESRLIEPELPKARLSGAFGDTYKIKLKKAGVRVVYQVLPLAGKIRVLAIVRRDSKIYEVALERRSRAL